MDYQTTLAPRHQLSDMSPSHYRQRRFPRIFESSSIEQLYDRLIPNRNNIDFDFCNYNLFNNAKYGSNIENELASRHNKSSGGVAVTRRLMNILSEKKSNDPVECQLFGRARKTSDKSVNTRVGDYTCRNLPTAPSKILDAPELVDDYYLNLLSWGANNVLAVALNQSVYLLHYCDGHFDLLFTLEEAGDHITSLEWSSTQPNILAVGLDSTTVQLWDSACLTKVRDMQGHTERVSSLSWNGCSLSSAGRDTSILNHDPRQQQSVQSTYLSHTQEGE